MDDVRWLKRVTCLGFFLALSGCATGSAVSSKCSNPALTARAPVNFGTVLTTAGGPTNVFRGGDLTDCDQLAFLEKEGISHILKLNASGEEAAVGLHQEGRFQVMPIDFHAFTIGRQSTCAKVRTALDYLEDSNNWPIYVHCAAGKDRTGYIIGMFEREALRRSAESVVEELGQFGHAGFRSLLFGQIDHELTKDTPVCAQQNPARAKP